jgi:hypothetical protein
MAYKVFDTMRGNVGELHSIDVKEGNVLVFVVPRATRHMNESYRDEGKRALDVVLPDGVQALMIGADVDIYELCGEDALALKLKGLLTDDNLPKKKVDK